MVKASFPFGRIEWACYYRVSSVATLRNLIIIKKLRNIIDYMSINAVICRIINNYKIIMKRFLLLLTCVLSLVGCSDNENSDKSLKAELDIKKIVNLINSSIDMVKEDMKEATLVKETNTLGETYLLYNLKTNEANYGISLDFNKSMKLYKISVSSADNYKSYSDAINVTKKLSDRINKIYADKHYNSYYTGETTASFDSPEEYWDYIAKHPVNKKSYEYRILKHQEPEGDKTIYQNIELWFLGDVNNFAIYVKRNEY